VEKREFSASGERGKEKEKKKKEKKDDWFLIRNKSHLMYDSFRYASFLIIFFTVLFY